MCHFPFVRYGYAAKAPTTIKGKTLNGGNAVWYDYACKKLALKSALPNGSNAVWNNYTGNIGCRIMVKSTQPDRGNFFTVYFRRYYNRPAKSTVIKNGHSIIIVHPIKTIIRPAAGSGGDSDRKVFGIWRTCGFAVGNGRCNRNGPRRCCF